MSGDFSDYPFYNVLDRTSEYSYTSGNESTYVLSGSAVGNNGLWHTRAIEHYGSLGTWSGVPYMMETPDGRNWEMGRASLVSGGGAGGAHILQRDYMAHRHVESSATWKGTDAKIVRALPYGPRNWTGSTRNENRSVNDTNSYTLPSVTSTSTPKREDLTLIALLSFDSRLNWAMQHGFYCEWSVTGSCANTGNITFHIFNIYWPETYPGYELARGGMTWRCVAGEMWTIKGMFEMNSTVNQPSFGWTEQGIEPWGLGLYAGFITGSTTFYLNKASASVAWGGSCRSTFGEYEWDIHD